jgi:hypothetical protein
MLKKLCAIAAVLLLAGCGGGGGGSGSGSTSTSGSGSGSGSGSSSGSSNSSGTLNNSVSVVIDQGPTALQAGPNGYISSNVAFVSVTICAPGSTTNCQTIDHVMVDTGSVGLRLVGSVLNTSLLNALPLQTDASSNPVGECYQYIDGYVFGSVRQGDLYIGGATPGAGQGEKVANMPLNVLTDPSDSRFSNAPSTCSAGGGTNNGASVQAFGANGIIGIGTTATDCGAACTSGTSSQLGQGNPIYYDCPSSGCSTAITRAASTSAPYQQVINPVAGMSVDNNGTVLVLAAEPSTGAATGSGTLYFGIGTQTNNGLGSAQVYTATSSSSAYGPGYIPVIYKNITLPYSFLDSGSGEYFFEDSTITTCATSKTSEFYGEYCPSSALSLNPTITGLNGASTSGAFTLYNAETQFNSNNGNNSVTPGVGANPSVLYPSVAQSFFSQSFDYGLPFFYGRSVYTAIEGRNAGGTTGPYFAF